MAVGPATYTLNVDYCVGGNGNGTTQTINKPSGLANGDYLYAFVVSNSAGNTWTPPSGWTLVKNFTSPRADALFRKYIPVASSESATNYTFTSSAGGRLAGTVFRASGVDTTTPEDVVSATIATGASGSVASPSVTTVTAGARLLNLISAYPGSNNTDATFTYPGGMTERIHFSQFLTSASTVVSVGFEDRPTAGATGTRTVTGVGTGGSGGNATPNGWMIALRPGATVPMGTAIKDGTGATQYLSYLDGSSVRKAPASVRVWYPGFSTVTASLAKAGAVWAHRGGSVDWPEMSEYAYDRSVCEGYGVLEFSAQRTSDGVWFGLHDANFDRTEITTGTPNASAVTWASVSARSNLLNAAGTPRPYYRLVDFLQKYTPSHVVVVDNKTSLNQTEFFDILDANGGPTRIVVKAYGVGTAGGLSTMATARGYQSWGYFYDTDYASGDLATYQGNWTILGMNVNAGTTEWTAVKSYGKKVVGHIATSQTMYNTAITKGADLVQVGAVKDVTPVSVWT